MLSCAADRPVIALSEVLVNEIDFGVEMRTSKRGVWMLKSYPATVVIVFKCFSHEKET